MKKSVQKKWNKLLKEGAANQEMAAFFWNSKKTSDEDKFWLFRHLSAMEDMINQSDAYNETQTEMAIIHMQLRVDAVQMFAQSHPKLKLEYDYSTHKKDGYQEWLRCYISANPGTELHIIQDRKAAKKFFSLQAQKERIRD